MPSLTLPPLDQILAFAQGHTLLLVAFIVVLLAIIANEAWGRLTGGPRLAITDAVRLINDEHALIVDVRGAAEYKKGHVMGAINLPSLKLKQRKDQIDKDLERPVIVYCNLGGTSLEAAKSLRALGHTHVYALRGGMNGWQNSNLPVTAK
ncbi:MAG TPA: rhodanese-like domain-containing protein [Nevskiaceae bacterium]